MLNFVVHARRVELLCGFEQRPEFDKTSTAKIRKVLGIEDPPGQQGSRVLYIIVFRKFRPITSLSRNKFLTAWWRVCFIVLFIVHNCTYRSFYPLEARYL